MGLISTEVWVLLHPSNIKWFEGLGYKIPKEKDNQYRIRIPKGTKLLVKVEDLLDTSNALVKVRCDECGEIEEIGWKTYKTNLKDDGKYYCKTCFDLKYKIFFKQWCYKHLLKENADIIISRWDYEKNIDKDGNIIKPEEIYYNSEGFDRKGYWFKCYEHLEHESELKSIANFTKGHNSLECNQCNTISITHPYLIKYLVNKEDMYKFSIGTRKKALVKCPNCGHEKEIKIFELVHKGIRCPKCSDGLPYSEKFLFSFFEQVLDNNFIVQVSKKYFKWCEKYRYDLYINKINGIVEAHGIQHYEEINNNWKTLNEIQENDILKENLAKDNGIDNYLVIDCRKSELEWIKNSIMKSRLPKLLNFKEEDIDWLKCHEYACNSLVKIVSDLWKYTTQNIPNIATILKLGVSTVSNYLKQGTELGWCDYDPYKEKGCKKIICLNTEEEFYSICEATRQYNIKSTSTISACCNKYFRYAGKHPETGENLVWLFYDEYLTKTEYQIKEILINAQVACNAKKIICITTGEIFDSVIEASNKYQINQNNISSCCCNTLKEYAGKHPETKQKMIWMHYDEYLESIA